MRLSMAPISLAVALCFAQVTFADEPAPAPAPTAVVEVPATVGTLVKVTEVEGITEYRLGNGLRVLLAPDDSKPTTTINVTYLVGSRMEKYGETGMAHLLEHMLFKGTPNLPGKTIVQEAAKRGMRHNASTYYDRTNFFETFNANEDNLDWALKMEADRMINSFVAKSDLDSEMTVVRNEMEMGENNPGRILIEKMTAAAYQWHSYGKDTIGARADVENVNIAHLQNFYHTYYQPDNAVLTVTGKFDVNNVLGKINAYFGAIPKPARTLEPLWTVEPVQDGARSVVLERVGETPIIAAMYHTAQGASPDTPALQALAQILADTPNGRLYKALVEKKLATNVSGEDAAMYDPGYALFSVELNKSQSPEKARKAMLEVLEDVARHPITEAELKRAKTQLLNDFDNALNDPNTFGIELTEAIAAGDWRLFFIDRDRIAALTVADVQRVAVNYLKESNRTLGEFKPTAKPDRTVMPAPVDIGKLVADYKGKSAMAAGETFDPTPANIEKRTIRMTMANGLKVVEVTKSTRGNTVHGTFTLHMGDVKSLNGKKYSAEAVASMLQRGAGKYTRQQIADRLDEMKAKLAIRGAGGKVTVSFETRRDQLVGFLELLHDILRSPTFPANEFEQLKTEWLTGLEEQRHDPEGIAANALSRYDNPYPKGDIRYAETFDEQIDAIKALKLADVKAFYNTFYGAEHGELALVGDFDRNTVDSQLTKLFSDWTGHAAYERVPEPFRESKATGLQLETPDKQNAIYLASLEVPLKDDAPDYIPLYLANRVLGGGSLKSRLADRLRQKDGISYSVASWLVGNPHEANSGMGMYAIYAPQNLDKLKAGVSDVLDAILKDGITQQELDEAKSGVLQEAMINRTQDGSLANQLASQLELGRTMAYSAAREAKIRAAKLDDVNAALRKYLTLDHLVQVYAGDFAGAAKKPAADKVSEN